MLILVFLIIIENIIISYFIINMLDIKNSLYFTIVNSILCTITTLLFNYYPMTTNSFAILFFIVILISIKIFKTKLYLNDIITAFLGLLLRVIADFFSLLIYNLITDSHSLTISTTNVTSVIIISLISTFFLFLFCQLTIYIKPKKNDPLSYKRWGILCPILLLLFSNIYILRNAIIFNSLSSSTSYLIINFITLSILMIVLCYIIQKENLSAKQIELNIQNEKYIRQNKNILLKLHDDISVIDHNNMYILLQIKHLLKNKKYAEIETVIDKNILVFKKYENIVYTGNPFFDQVFNRELNNYNINNQDIKTICSISNNDFQIDKYQMDFIIFILRHLLSISKKDNPFSIEISNKSNFIILSFVLCNDKNIDKDFLTSLEKFYSFNYIEYNYILEKELLHFKVLVKVK